MRLFVFLILLLLNHGVAIAGVQKDAVVKSASGISVKDIKEKKSPVAFFDQLGYVGGSIQPGAKATHSLRLKNLNQFPYTSYKDLSCLSGLLFAVHFKEQALISWISMTKWRLLFPKHNFW